MKKLKIYLETSLFNFYVDEKMGRAHEDTVRLFKEVASGKYDAYSSVHVVEELRKAQPEKSRKMLDLFSEYNIVPLEHKTAADDLAGVYVSEGVIPSKYKTDGIHIAIAAVYGLDMIVSMNFNHIVKRKTVRMTGAINILNGYKAVEIYSPTEVVEDE